MKNEEAEERYGGEADVSSWWHSNGITWDGC